MAHSDTLKDKWGKVQEGLAAAGATSEEIEAVKATLNRLSTLTQAEAAFEHFGFSDRQRGAEAGRRLHRAAFCLHYLLARQDDTVQAFNLDRRQTQILASDASDSTIQTYIRKCLNKLTGASEAPIVRPDSGTTVVASVVVPEPVSAPSPALARFRQAVGTVGQAQAAKLAARAKLVSAFQQTAQDQLAKHRLANTIIRQDASGLTHFVQTINDIRDHYNEQKFNALFNFTTLKTAVDQAYKDFHKVVQDGQSEAKFKVKMAESLFGLLEEHLPKPFSLIGTIGKKVTGQLHVDESIDQDASYSALSPEPTGRLKAFAGNLAKSLGAAKESYADFTRVGMKLNALPQARDFGSTLDSVTKCWFEIIQDVVRATVDGVFGENSTKREERFTDFVNDLRLNRLPTGKLVNSSTQAEQLKLLVTQEIDQIKRETTQKIDQLTQGGKVTLIDQKASQGAFELMLYGLYLEQLFKNEGGGYDFSKTIPAAIVTRLANKDDGWALLMTQGTKIQAQAAHRLKWEDRENHKRALLYFFQWYARKMSPFLMVVGAVHDGQAVSPEVIQREIRAYIDKLNQAIIANAAKDGFFSIRTTWDWTKISQSMGQTL
jgi:hypothetical protein